MKITIKSFFVLFFLYFLSTYKSNNLYAQDYSKVAGLYQAYSSGIPVDIQGMNMYYVFNKNGIIVVAFGSSSGRAFADVSGGIKSGRILTGKYSLSGNLLSVKMDKGETKIWRYKPSENSIESSSGTISLKFIENL